ncbi:MAG: peptidylprolyl isomerase [Anaerolineales bacterium]|nr:peptidylprolyl isomerase [Anaerolineales bacterium]
MKKSFNLTPNTLIGAERDRFITRLLTIGTIAIVVIVLALVGYAYAHEKYIVPRQTLARVEGVEISGAQYQQRVRVNRTRVVNLFMQYYQMQSLITDPSFQQQLSTQLMGMQYDLQPLVMGESTLNELIDDELLKLAAADNGIEISEADVERELQSYFGYFPQGTPTSQPTRTPYATATLNATQQSLLGITPSAEEAATATVQPTATSASSNATPVPSATPVNEEGYRQLLSEYFTTQAGEGVDEQAIRELVYANLLRQAYRQKFEPTVANSEDQVWARHILVATQQEAIEVLARLAAGEDFASVASEVSLDTGSKNIGGDLGWFPRGRMVEPFEEAAFALPVGSTSEVVQTDFGWHVIQVLGHQEQPMSETDFNQRVEDALNAYLAELREQYDWEIIGERWKAATPDKPDLNG